MGDRTGRPRGRPPGAKNKRTEQREQRMAEQADAIADALGDAFEGDAHALLMSIYKDPARDLAHRLDAAKAAIRYEKPAMASIEVGNKDDKPFTQEIRWAQSDSEATPDPSKK